MVSELKNQLSGFRRDRGVDDPVEKEKLSMKLFIPEQDPNDPRERNWVCILIPTTLTTSLRLLTNGRQLTRASG